MREDQLFTTYDLNLSAVLVSLDIPLLEARKTNNAKFLFCFEHTKQLDLVVNQYWKQELELNPQKLFNSLKSIKNRMYSNYQSQK